MPSEDLFVSILSYSNSEFVIVSLVGRTGCLTSCDSPLIWLLLDKLMFELLVEEVTACITTRFLSVSAIEMHVCGLGVLREGRGA